MGFKNETICNKRRGGGSKDRNGCDVIYRYAQRAELLNGNNFPRKCFLIAKKYNFKSDLERVPHILNLHKFSNRKIKKKIVLNRLFNHD